MARALSTARLPGDAAGYRAIASGEPRPISAVSRKAGSSGSGTSWSRDRSTSTSSSWSYDVTVKLNPDGSGTLVERTMMQKQFLDQLKQVAEGFSAGGMKADKAGESSPGDMFSGEQAGKRAASYGPGVELVSARRISDAEAEGMEAVYSFKDVSRLRLNQKPDSVLPGGISQGKRPAPAGMPQSLRFERLPGGNALLTLTIPWDKARTNEQGETPTVAHATGGKPPMSQEQLAQAMRMFQGMRISLAVEPQGTLVSTNSPYVSGNRVTLFEMNVDEVLTGAADPASFTKMMASPPASETEARKLLEQFKGIKFCLEPEIRIEFSPK